MLQIKIFGTSLARLNFIRPFLISKGSLNNCKIMLKKEQEIITATKEIVQVLNHHKIILLNITDDNIVTIKDLWN